MMKFSISNLLPLFLLVFLVNSSHGALITAKSCAKADVQSAINSAFAGDVVTIPAGSCNWSGQVSIPDSKKITLRGAGRKATLITRSGTAIRMNESGSRVTGIGFLLPSGSGPIIDVSGEDWRIDNSDFINTTGNSEVSIHANGRNRTVNPRGLIDNNYFKNGRVLVNGLYTLEKMNRIWSEPLNLGTAEAVYVEDCTFERDDDATRNAIDANRGGRYVFRFNKLTDTYLEAHSVQGSGQRATRKWEIYNNTIISDRSSWTPFFIRGGTGVVFNNTVVGSWSNPNVTIDNVRSCFEKWGLCNGSSPIDGNMTGLEGYPCRDQIGMSTDQWLWTSSNPYPPQDKEPAYIWNNKYGDSQVGVKVTNCSRNKVHLGKNRDWYLGIPKPGYSPYVYPHPMRDEEGGGPQPLPAPANLRVSKYVK